MWLEKYLHQAFSHRRVKLEWFRLTEEDVKLIRSITAADGVDDLPSAIAAQHTINEANGFGWGERDDAAEVCGAPTGFMVRLPDRFRPVMEALRKKNRRPMTEEVQIALEKYVLSEGISPPT